MVDWVSYERPGALVLCTLVLEPSLDLSLAHSQCQGKSHSVSWQKIVLLFKAPLENFNLLWSKPHSSPFG